MKMTLYWVAMVIGLTCAQLDLTRRSGMFGSLVTKTVVKLLHDACIIEDHLLLRRIAYHETKDGTTASIGNDGGIWKVDEAMFNFTQSGTPELQKLYTEVQNKLFLNWKSIKWADLKKPFFSGLAAAIYLRAKTNESIPRGIADQAKYWKTYYRNGGDENNFRMDISTMSEGCMVADEIDLAFILETSSNVNPVELNQAKAFMKSIINSFTVSASKLQVALVTYGSQATVWFYFNTHNDKKGTLNGIDSVLQSGGSVATEDGLRLTSENIFQKKNGAREGASHIAVLITKSRSDKQSDTIYKSSLLKGNNVHLFIFGIGAGVDQSVLRKSSSQPDCNFYNHFPKYDDLNSFQTEFDEAVCDVPSIMTDGDFSHPCNVDSLIKIPDNPYGSTVKLKIVAGTKNVYGSFMTSLPDSVLYDLTSQINQTTPFTLFLSNNSADYFISIKSVLGASCTGRYNVSVSVGPPQVKPASMICILRGQQTNCTNITMSPPSGLSLHNQTLPNICVNNITMAPHPTDPTKFLMCDKRGQLLTVQCPPKESFCSVTNFCEMTCPLTSTTKQSSPVSSLSSSTQSTIPPIVLVFTTPSAFFPTASASLAKTSLLPGIYTKSPVSVSPGIYTKAAVSASPSPGIYTKLITSQSLSPGIYTKSIASKSLSPGIYTKTKSLSPGIYTKTKSLSPGIYTKTIPSKSLSPGIYTNTITPKPLSTGISPGIYTKVAITPSPGIYTRPTKQSPGIYTKAAITPSPGIYTRPTKQSPGIYTKAMSSSTTLSPGIYTRSTRPPGIYTAAVTSSTSKPNCTLSQNQCNSNAFQNNILYFAHCDEHKYYQCTGVYKANEIICPTDKIFNPDISTCVNEFVLNEDTGKYDKTIPNPCKHVHGDRYFAHPTDRSSFIHCDGFWNGFMRSCPSGETFSSLAGACVGNGVFG